MNIRKDRALFSWERPFNQFFWSGGTERVINTKSTTVVEDIVEDLCNVIGKSIECKVEERQS
jgi:hypothetical protein